jgi:tetratricopeptide (TPR) repeat protein
VVAWYLYAASAADTMVTPQRDRVAIDMVSPPVDPPAFRDIDSALSWAERERMNLVAVTRLAADYGFHEAAWRVPVAVLGCFNTLSCRTEWMSSHLVALESARSIGDRRGEAWVLNNLGLVHWQLHIDDAFIFLQEALDIRREIGDRRGEAQTANNIANAHLQRGRSEEALEPLHRALVLQRQVGHRFGEGVALNNIGEAHLGLEDWNQAIDWLEQAHHLFAELETPRGEGYALHNLGQAHLGLAQYQEALDHFRRALAVRRAIGQRHDQAVTLLFIGRAQARMGRLAEARQSWTEASALFDELEDEAQAVQTRAELATLNVATA